MIRTFALESGKLREQELADPPSEVDLQSASWIDLQDAEQNERQAIERLFPQSLPDANEVEEIESSARYFVEGDDLHVHSLFLYQSEGRFRTATVAFTLNPHRLISTRDVELPDFRLTRLRARRGWIEASSPLQVMIALFEQKVDNLADQLEDLHRSLEQVSNEVLENREADLGEQLDRLAKLEDSNGQIRLCLMDTQRSTSFLLRHIRQDTAGVDTCREILRDLDTLMAHATFVFEKINFLLNAAQGFINIRQNQIIKIFSIAAVVFLPPTLVGTVYGMNFHTMPELDWVFGYPMALGLMVVSAISPYLFFKHKGWL
ncbi:magnesium/cobalt transporter CorA [Marinobacterium sediminicola]|uniref:Magnesium transport protein CorA n=1 Tax=Marinobacterium sediminicola TaxID=518898 RepID=A0ABY1RZA2_9GAMM|nr:magnesium/cobalt transporter CorA [Marinobacterium sediminicola]ULG68015.1 magnesium/cobalt transporter CorA [Marinobacterium sediminicola]SMR73475.1 magnesium transporter [Marinobacterium sediminicola]